MSALTPEALEARMAAIRFVAFDFDGVFTDNSVYVTESGKEAVRCSRADGFGLSALRKAGVEVFVISTETNPVVSARCAKLSIPCVQACEDKLAALGALLDKRRLDLADAAFVGNDVNDVACLKAVGLPIVVRDAHPDVLEFAAYRTEALGGNGAVREVCDLIVKAVRG